MTRLAHLMSIVEQIVLLDGELTNIGRSHITHPILIAPGGCWQSVSDSRRVGDVRARAYAHGEL